MSELPRRTKTNSGGKKPEAIGDILARVVRREGIGKKQLNQRQTAQKVLRKHLGEKEIVHARVIQVRAGVVLIECDSAILFQEIESFLRHALLEHFQGAGLKVREIRVRLATSL